MTRIELFENSIDEEEKISATNALSSKWLINGPEVQQFESEFSNYIGADYAVAVNSCTAGLHGCLAALELSQNDEVIFPAFNFAAVACAVLQSGGKPVFCDVGTDGTVTVESLERAISPNTRAFMVLHYAGRVADMKAISALANRHGIAVIEDAAHALGAEIDGQKVGASGFASVFSFGPAKHLVTSMGGMITTNNIELAEKLKVFRSYGMSRSMYDRRDKDQHWLYDVNMVGHNFRMPDVLAAIGRKQLFKINGIIQKRREIARRYDKAFLKLSNELKPLPTIFDRGLDSPLYYVIQLNETDCRDRLSKWLRGRDIDTSIHWPKLLSDLSVFSTLNIDSGNFPMAQKLATSVLTLPLHQNLSDSNVETVIQAVNDFFETRA